MDDGIERLTSLMDDMLKMQQKMSKAIIDQRSQILAVQTGVLAIAEQLAARGTLDAEKAAVRVIELAGAIVPKDYTTHAAPHVALFAARLDQFSGKPQPPKPRGRGPKLIVDNDD